MLIIRLQRVGRKNDPSFRVVVTDSKNSSKSGKFLEILGAYNPRKTAAKTVLKVERIQHWIAQGSQVSDTMHNLLLSKKLVTGETVNVASKKLGKKAQALVDAKKAAEAKKEADAKKAKEEAEAAKAEPVVETPAEEIPVEAPAETITEEVA